MRLSSIFDKNGADMFDENGKFVAKVKPGYNDLDWSVLNMHLESLSIRQPMIQKK